MTQTKVTENEIFSTGWADALSVWTYTSYDSDVRTGVVATASDESGHIQLGDRLTFTQSVDGIKYAIVTAITSSAITFFMYEGDDLDNATITLPKFSHQKNPYGFDIDVTKWTVEATSTSLAEQTTPTSGTWYNLGSIDIDIPIGVWIAYYETSGGARQVNTNDVDYFITLSTANNSESDSANTCYTRNSGGTNSNYKSYNSFYKRIPLTLTTKDTFYLNAKTTNTANSIYFFGLDADTIIRAECAYL